MKIKIKENTSKYNISKHIYSNFGFSENFSKNLLNDIIDSLIIELLEKNCLKIKNFATFKIKKKDKRIGRNPKTKEKFNISERNVIQFKASENLKKIIEKTKND